MSMGIEINLGFGAQDRNCVTRFGMFAQVIPILTDSGNGFVRINHSTRLTGRNFKVDFFVRQDWHAQSDAKHQKRDNLTQNCCRSRQNLREFADCQASKERYRRKNKDEIMRSKIKSRANRQR